MAGLGRFDRFDLVKSVLPCPSRRYKTFPFSTVSRTSKLMLFCCRTSKLVLFCCWTSKLVLSLLLCCMGPGSKFDDLDMAGFAPRR